MNKVWLLASIVAVLTIVNCENVVSMLTFKCLERLFHLNDLFNFIPCRSKHLIQFYGNAQNFVMSFMVFKQQ